MNEISGPVMLQIPSSSLMKAASGSSIPSAGRFSLSSVGQLDRIRNQHHHGDLKDRAPRNGQPPPHRSQEIVEVKGPQHP